MTLRSVFNFFKFITNSILLGSFGKIQTLIFNSFSKCLSPVVVYLFSLYIFLFSFQFSLFSHYGLVSKHATNIKMKKLQISANGDIFSLIQTIQKINTNKNNTITITIIHVKKCCCCKIYFKIKQETSHKNSLLSFSKNKKLCNKNKTKQSKIL